MAVPVAYHQPVEMHFAAQQPGQQRLVAVHLFAVDARKRGHHRLRARRDCRTVSRRVNPDQRIEIAARIAAIDPAGPAIAEEMLERRENMVLVEKFGRSRLALQPFDQRRPQPRHHRGLFGQAFIAAAPARIARHRQRGGESPVEPGRGDFGGGRLADAVHQRGIVCGAERDIVREQRGADDVVVTMDGIGGPQQRDGRFAPVERRGRCGPERIGKREVGAGRRLVIAARPAVSAIQDRTEAIAAHVFGRDRGDIGLDELRDLVFEAHARQQAVDPRLDR